MTSTTGFGIIEIKYRLFLMILNELNQNNTTDCHRFKYPFCTYNCYCNILPYKRRKSHDNQSSHFGLIVEITRQSYEKSPVPKSKMKLVSSLVLEFCTR